MAEPVELPTISQGTDIEVGLENEPENKPDVEAVETGIPEQPVAESVPRPETPATSQPPSEDIESTAPTTPSSSNQTQLNAPGDTTPVATMPTQRATKPVVPIIPALPKTVPRDATRKVSGKSTEDVQPAQVATPSMNGNGEAQAQVSELAEAEEVKEAAPAPKAWTTPKLWTGLFNPAAAASTASSESGAATAASGFGKANSETLADALRSFNAVSNDSKLAFIEPRGLVNTGNMCYMNSVGLPDIRCIFLTVH